MSGSIKVEILDENEELFDIKSWYEYFPDEYENVIN